MNFNKVKCFVSLQSVKKGTQITISDIKMHFIKSLGNREEGSRVRYQHLSVESVLQPMTRIRDPRKFD